MYDVCHPVYYRICELGCKDDVKITTAFHVYIELCEERKLWAVDYKYDSTLDLIYLEAKKKQNSKADIYVPWAVKNNLKLDTMHEIQKQLNIQCFTLVLRNGDGTILFYTVNSGLKKPLSPQERLELRSKNDIKKNLNRELRKNSRNLFEMAKLRAGDPGNHDDK